LRWHWLWLLWMMRQLLQQWQQKLLHSDDGIPEPSRQQVVDQEPDAQGDEEDFGRYIKVIRMEVSRGGQQPEAHEGLSREQQRMRLEA